MQRKNILYQENGESLRENEIKKVQGCTSFYIEAEVNYTTLQKQVACNHPTYYPSFITLYGNNNVELVVVALHFLACPQLNLTPFQVNMICRNLVEGVSAEDF